MSDNEMNLWEQKHIELLTSAEMGEWLARRDKRRDERLGFKVSEVPSHSESEIYKGCLALMQELVDDFMEWYKWQHGEDAIEELDEEEMFCVRKTPFHIVQRLFLWGTHHSGGCSTRSKCSQLGIKDWSDDIEFCFEKENEEE